MGLKYKKTVLNSCGYTYDQYVLQSPDVDAKVVLTYKGTGKGQDSHTLECHIDTDNESAFLRVDRTGGIKRAINFAKEQTLLLATTLAPHAKPGKRSEQ